MSTNQIPGRSAWARSHKLNEEAYKGDKGLDLIKKQMYETRFESFIDGDAFILGNTIRELYYAQNINTGILISIRLFSGLTVYQLACGSDVNPTNEDWVRRKYNTVKEYGMPTLQKGRELEKKGRNINSLEPEYAAHGGGYPIYIKNCSVPIGAVIVSGLSQELDHALIVDSILHIKEQDMSR